MLETSEPPGLDVTALTEFLPAHGMELAGPLVARLFAGGRSNLTYELTDGVNMWVLRRPPLGHVLETAHDMSREFRFISALGPSVVPVPQALVRCDDAAVIGAPFFVMSHVEGVVYRTREQLEALGADDAHRMAAALADTLADLHAVDPAAIGLADIGRPDGYLARQCARLATQLDASRTRDVPGLDDLGAKLAESLPASDRSTIVHGDYRLDNTLISSDPGRVAAVLDWELATLGDPLVDVASLVGGWDGGNGLFAVVTSPPGQIPHYPDWTVLAERYAERTGQSLDALPWHMAFLMYKGAVIFEGIHCRYVRGETVGPGYREIGEVVPAIVEAAHAQLAGQ
jgi:aminoglycoside phosphotransferase (APT) family kinase protein